MTARTFLSIISAVCFLGIAASISAQEVYVDQQSQRTYYLRSFIGVYGGLGINLHTSGFGELPGFPSCCQEYKDNTSVGPVFGAMFELPILHDLRFQARLGYAGLGGTLSTQQVIGNEPVLDDGPVPTTQRTDVLVEHTLEASIPLVIAEPTIGYRVLDFFWISGGVRAGFMLGSSFEQSERLYSPDGYTFLDGSTVRNQSSGSIPDANAFQLHGVLGLGYELLTKSRVSLVPEVRYYLPFTKVASVDWMVQSFQIGISVRWGLYSPKDPVIIRDTMYVRDTVIVQKPNLRSDNMYLSKAEDSEEQRELGDSLFVTTTISESYIKEIPRPFQPTIGVKFFALNADGKSEPINTMRIEELDVIENYPILPQIFFTHNNDALDSTSQFLFDAEQARDFRPMDLSRDQIDVYRNTLNIAAYRLKQNPDASISLTGCVDNVDDEKNNKELAKRRAEAVKKYFTDVWGLSSDRIKTSARALPSSPANPATADGQSENRRVELSSDDLGVLEPVEFKDKDNVVKPKDITLRPTVQNGEDISAWEANVMQGTTELMATQGTGQPTAFPWNAGVNGARPRSDKPVISNLTVRNELGQTYTSTDTLDVDYVTVQLMKSSEEGGKLIERYSLIVFEFNSAQLNPSNQRVMERVKGRIQPESKVKIIGFADRQGNPDYNRTLARKRCIEAQRVLDLPDNRVTIEPIGSDRLIYNNDIPEGRSYSRTVHIEIETPLR